MLRLQADRGKRTMTRPGQPPTIRACHPARFGQDHAAARLALARQVLTEVARDVPEKKWPGQENDASTEQKNWRGRTRK
jgi:hypothetical protein